MYPTPLGQRILWSGNDSQGLDKDWCAEVAIISFSHSYTDYNMQGEGLTAARTNWTQCTSASTREAFFSAVSSFWNPPARLILVWRRPWLLALIGLKSMTAWKTLLFLIWAGPTPIRS